MQKNKIEEREYKIKKDENYKVPSKGMIVSWRLKTEVKNPRLVVDDYTVEYDFKDFFSVSQLRNYVRDISFPEKEEDDRLITLEDKFYLNQLYGTEFYQFLSNRELFDSLFTRDMNIRFVFDDSPEEVVIVEEYWNRN